MTDRKRQTGNNNAARILVTGASIAAGFGLIAGFDAAAAGSATNPQPEPVAVATQPQAVQVVRRVVVVPSTQPDVVLHAAGASGATVIQEQAPAPVIRTRPAATQTSTQAQPAPVVVQSPPPAQTTSSGS